MNEFMEQTWGHMIEQIWGLPRDLVSDGYDRALHLLSEGLDLEIHEFKSGSRCWNWTIPPKWTCRGAFIERMNGERILDYVDCPLHVGSYSRPVDGIVSRQELLSHLHTHAVLENAVPYSYHFYVDNWSFGSTKSFRDRLTEEQYRVRIDSKFEQGTLKVGELIVRGKSNKSIVLCAHIDHPCQVNDGLIGAIAGIEVFKKLMLKSDLNYTYRLVLVPETIGSVAYLSRFEELIPDMVGGIFLEMLGLDNSLYLQHSTFPEGLFDRTCKKALREYDPNLRTGAFLRVVANDERQFNGAGVRVPMISLSRVDNAFLEGDVFEAYHSHLDNKDRINFEKLNESCGAIMALISEWERTAVPYPKFKGEPFLTGYGVTYDFENERDLSQLIVELIYQMDGKSSIQDIAEALGEPTDRILLILKEFETKNMIELLGT